MHISEQKGFALMWYRCQDCNKKERIWNSRAGVTPFMIGCSDCDGTMQHENFHLDKYAPDHILKMGDRIFIDLTEGVAMQKYRQQIDHYWNYGEYPISKMFETKESALKSFMEQWQPGTPMVTII